MELFSSLGSLRLEQSSRVHLALGSFDGLHLGHQTLVAKLPLGQGPKLCCGALVFSPHPSKILRPEAPTALLMPDWQQESHFRGLKLDFLIRHPFDPTLAQTPALAFLTSLKRSIPSLAGLYIGEDFRFGKKREGDVSLMAQWAHQESIHLEVLPLFCKGGLAVTSSRIRPLIQVGNFKEANDLLGYTYYAEGKLEEDAQGLFLRWEPELRPPEGLYTGFLPKQGGSVDLHYRQGKVYIKPIQGYCTQLGLELKIEFTSLTRLC